MPFYWYRENKTCPHCGERFAPRWREQYCSPTCKQQAQTKRRRERRVEQRKRDLDQATCRVCGTPLTDAQRRSRRYCSSKCRQTAFRELRRALP